MNSVNERYCATHILKMEITSMYLYNFFILGGVFICWQDIVTK